MAGVLAGAGLKVVVLESGGYFDDRDFTQLELPAYQNLFWRGGPTPTADLNVSLQAGSCLGGGTVINWTNSLRTTPWVREQWESEFGLPGLAGPDFDGHLDAVWERLGVNDGCSELNGPQQRMKAGADALGWSFATANRNTDPRALLLPERRLPRLRRPERLKALHRQDLSAGRPGERRGDGHALLRRARARRWRPGGRCAGEVDRPADGPLRSGAGERPPRRRGVRVA